MREQKQQVVESARLNPLPTPKSFLVQLQVTCPHVGSAVLNGLRAPGGDFFLVHVRQLSQNARLIRSSFLQRAQKKAQREPAAHNYCMDVSAQVNPEESSKC